MHGIRLNLKEEKLVENPKITTTTGDESYEMFWNCDACGTKKLLGVTHRNCPECGLAQNANARYFPAEGEAVALKNHVYTGADWACDGCGNPNSSKAKFCVSCGCGNEGAKSVTRKTSANTSDAAPGQQSTQTSPQPVMPGAAKASSSGSFIKIGVIAVVLGILAFVFYPRTDTGVIKSHNWEKVIKIEHSVAKTETLECANVKSNMQVRDMKFVNKPQKMQDGESCKDVCANSNVDQGDGSFKVEKKCKQECSPKYVTKNVMIKLCEVEYPEWLMKREEKTAGQSTSDKMDWPNPTLQGKSTSGYGEERIGRRVESYRVQVERKGKIENCEIASLDAWRQFQVGQNVTLKSKVIGGSYCP